MRNMGELVPCAGRAGPSDCAIAPVMLGEESSPPTALGAHQYIRAGQK